MKDNIPGYPGYHVTKDGKVYSRYVRGHSILSDSWRLIKPRLNNKGRPKIRLKILGSNITHSVYVNRLVAIKYIPNPHNYPVVMHLDNNPLNNHYTNLKWGTQSMNIQQAYDEGRRKDISGKNNPMYGKKGILSPTHKISPHIRSQIINDYNTGSLSQRAISQKYSISQAQVSRIVNNNKG